MQEFTEVGKSVGLVDGVEKATGAAKFASDVQLPGMLHVKCLRSPFPHAEIVNIDTSKAERLPGVKAILTYKNVPEVPMASPTARPMLIIDKKVRLVGDEVAAVAAVDEDTAQDALELIDVEYNVLPAVFDSEEAIKPEAPQIHPEGNISGPEPGKPWIITLGDVKEGFEQADRIFEDSFDIAPTQHSALETLGCVANWEGEKLTIWASTQSPYEVHYHLHQVLDVPMNKIKVINTYVGGGFGGKHDQRMFHIAALLARTTRRPVSYIYTREEEFIAARRRHALKTHMKLGIKNDGTITAIQGRSVFDVGAYGMVSGGSCTNYGYSWMPYSTYRYQNLYWECWDVCTNLPTAEPMRGVSSTAQAFCLEMFLDKVATELGIDPVELRLKNCIRSGDPLDTGLTKLSSCALDNCLKIGAERIGWKEKREKTGEATSKKRRGMGVAAMLYGTSFWRCIASATVKFQEDGTINVLAGSADMGQGTRTTLAQIAAEVLRLPTEDVVVTNFDTSAAPFAPTTAASCTLITMGQAVKGAAEEAKQHLLSRAADKLGAKVEDIELGNRRAYVKANPEKSVPIATLCEEATLLPPRPPFPGETVPTGSIMGKASHEHQYVPTTARMCAAHFAEVEVDIETGKVGVLRMVMAHDSGKPINPGVVEGQIEGATSMGIGYALSEELAFDEGRTINPSYMDFKLLTAKDMPQMEPIIVDSFEPLGPFGGKGVGEGAAIPPAPAIANAIYNATGVQVKERPMTPGRVLKALRKAGIKG